MVSSYRGYVSTRSLNGVTTPQMVQNAFIRDYARRKGLNYLLSAVEQVMPNSYQVLHDILSQLRNIDGIIFYSIFMLPAEQKDREYIYKTMLDNSKKLHFALEDFSIKEAKDIEKIEVIYLIKKFEVII